MPTQVLPDTLLCPDNLGPVLLRGSPTGGTWTGCGVSGSLATGFVFTVPAGFVPSPGFTFDLVYTVRAAGGCTSRARQHYCRAVGVVAAALILASWRR